MPKPMKPIFGHCGISKINGFNQYRMQLSANAYGTIPLSRHYVAAKKKAGRFAASRYRLDSVQRRGPISAVFRF